VVINLRQLLSQEHGDLRSELRSNLYKFFKKAGFPAFFLLSLKITK